MKRVVLAASAAFGVTFLVSASLAQDNQPTNSAANASQGRAAANYATAVVSEATSARQGQRAGVSSDLTRHLSARSSDLTSHLSAGSSDTRGQSSDLRARVRPD